MFRLSQTDYLVNQGARSAAFLERFVNSFLKKVGEFIKKGFREPHRLGLRDSESLIIIELGR